MGTEVNSRYHRLRQRHIDCHRHSRSSAVSVIRHDAIAPKKFRGGMIYQTLVGDERGSTPIRVGIQTSSPGYKTLPHSHPYMEVITVLAGQGEAWIEGHEG